MDFILNFFKSYVPVFSEKDFEEFNTIVENKHFNKGEIIAIEGKIATNFYIWKSGVIGSFITDSKGKEFINTLYTPIMSSGALYSLITNAPSHSTYVCLTDCEVVEGDFKAFLELTANKHIFSTLYRKFLEAIFIRTENKLLDLSLLNATERYIKLKKDIPNISNLIPQHQIASYLNITPVQLSRIRKKIYSK